MTRLAKSLEIDPIPKPCGFVFGGPTWPPDPVRRILVSSPIEKEEGSR
jgi:hypothetical protein